VPIIQKKKTTAGLKSTDRLQHNDSGKLQYPIVTNRWVIQMKINKETSELTDMLDQMDLMDIYRVFHPTTMQYTWFLAVH
jgi:exonuclease III